MKSPTLPFAFKSFQIVFRFPTMYVFALQLLQHIIIGEDGESYVVNYEREVVALVLCKTYGES